MMMVIGAGVPHLVPTILHVPHVAGCTAVAMAGKSGRISITKMGPFNSVAWHAKPWQWGTRRRRREEAKEEKEEAKEVAEVAVQHIRLVPVLPAQGMRMTWRLADDGLYFRLLYAQVD